MIPKANFRKSCLAAVIISLLVPAVVMAQTVGIILPRDCALGPDTKDKFSAQLAKNGFDMQKATVYLQRPASDKVSRINSMRKFLAFGVEVIVVWGGTAIKEIRAESGKTPFVFVGATDPVKDGLVKSLEAPGGSVTGILGRTSISYLLDNIAESVGAGKLGVIYHSDVTDSNSQFEALEKAAPAKGFSLVAFDAKGGDMASSAASLADVKFIFLAQGCEVEGASMANLASLGKPIATQSPGLTGSGVVFTLAPDVDESIKEAADMAARILKGEKPGNIPVARPKKISFVINMGEAKRLGVKVPFTVLNKATEVVR
jgi:putative ABC transport system substrate-binding protein